MYQYLLIYIYIYANGEGQCNGQNDQRCMAKWRGLFSTQESLRAQGPTKAQRSNGRGHMAGFCDSDDIAAIQAKHALVCGGK